MGRGGKAHCGLGSVAGPGLASGVPRSCTFLMEECSRNPLQWVLEAQVLVPTQPLLRLLLPLSPSSGPVPPDADAVLPGPRFLSISPAALALPSPSFQLGTLL